MTLLRRPARRSPRKATPEPARWHHHDGERAASLLEVNLVAGLTSLEARRRIETFGPNRITLRRGTPAWLRFAKQFHQPLVYILLVAVAVTACLGEWVDSSVIFGVVFANGLVGFAQEAKAAKAIESLARMVLTPCTVRRDGRQQHVHADELVPGDIVLLHPGDRVPADLRLIRIKGLHVDESALTGESVPVHKHPDPLALDTVLADRKNLAYTGSLVTGGQGEGVVWATGDRTELGRIATLIAEAVNLQTPLTVKITHFSKLLLWVILALAAATFAVGILRGRGAFEMFMATIALAVGAIPEGLPAAVTIVLAIGVARMAKRRAIIRKLPAVETLGSTTVICSDKTGTLTKNQMTVASIFAGGRIYDVTGAGYEPNGEIQFQGVQVHYADHPALGECLRAGVLCNDSQLLRNPEGRIELQGDPTEAALLVVGEKGGLPQERTHADSPRLDVIPFESEHMFRATLHHTESGRVIYKVGAVERLLDRCTDTLGSDGQLTALDKYTVRSAVETMADRGLRVLGLARRHVHSSHACLDHSHVSEGLTFLGLQGMIDPPRPEAVEAIRRCQEAGIAVTMITGDHLGTARAIAGQIGLKGRQDHGVLVARTGRELEQMTDEELPEVAEHTAVFARVAPEQKLRLVRALQARGHVVAMTGDGVNDAPALKQADIGIAMGISGTDVAKSAASMVLTDDNFASIEAAVEEGRGVFDNLTKFIVWTLPTNIGEAMVLLVAILLGTALPALPVQLLWVNLSTAVFLGLMLVFEPKEQGLMQRPPRDPKKPLLTHALVMRTGLVSLVMFIGAYGLFFWELTISNGLAEARTAVINVIVLVEIAYLFNCRSLNRMVFAAGALSNRWAIAGSLGMLAAQLLFTYTPMMNKLFHSTPIGAETWLRIALVAVFGFAVVELEKWLRYGVRHGNLLLPE